MEREERACDQKIGGAQQKELARQFHCWQRLDSGTGQAEV
jgi:hypothetical protein